MWGYVFSSLPGLARKKRQARLAALKRKKKGKIENEISGIEMTFWFTVVSFFVVTTYLVMVTKELNLPRALYFLVVTMTGVGFGEMYPASQKTRIVIMIFALIGNTILFMIASEIMDLLMDAKLELLRRMKRAVIFAGVGHGTRAQQMKAVLRPRKTVKGSAVSHEDDGSCSDLAATKLPNMSRLKKKVDAMWVAAPKQKDGQMERLECWEMILADEELARLVGRSEAEEGRALLLAMKEVRALDAIKTDGRVSAAEFVRIYQSDVLVAADRKVKADRRSLEDVEPEIAKFARRHTEAVERHTRKRSFKVDDASRSSKSSVSSSGSGEDLVNSVTRGSRRTRKGEVMRSDDPVTDSRVDQFDPEEAIKDARVPAAQQLATIFAGLGAYILLGGLIMSLAEGWNYGDACYFSIIAATTIGYGDFYPETVLGRWLIFFLLVPAVIFVNLTLSSIGEVFSENTVHDAVSKVLSADLSLEHILLLMDKDGNGKVTEYEFLFYAMTNTGLAEASTLEDIHKTFLKLDRDKSGRLDRNDIRKHAGISRRKEPLDLVFEMQSVKEGGGGGSQVKQYPHVVPRRAVEGLENLWHKRWRESCEQLSPSNLDIVKQRAQQAVRSKGRFNSSSGKKGQKSRVSARSTLSDVSSTDSISSISSEPVEVVEKDGNLYAQRLLVSQEEEEQTVTSPSKKKENEQGSSECKHNSPPKTSPTKKKKRMHVRSKSLDDAQSKMNSKSASDENPHGVNRDPGQNSVSRRAPPPSQKKSTRSRSTNDVTDEEKRLAGEISTPAWMAAAESYIDKPTPKKKKERSLNKPKTPTRGNGPRDSSRHIMRPNSARSKMHAPRTPSLDEEIVDGITSKPSNSSGLRRKGNLTALV